MFLLDGERDPQAFTRYATYLEAHRAQFPPLAYELATSDWYFDVRNHRCPHDGWLEAAQLVETSGVLALTIRIRAAYHDGTIELHYPRVVSYAFEGTAVEQGHRDWRYDELRLDPQGRLEHEIEWCGPEATARWLIVAADVHYRWTAI